MRGSRRPPSLVERRFQLLGRRRRAEGQEAPNRYRQNRVPAHMLGRIPDAQAGGAGDFAAIRLNDAEDHADQGRFARTVEADQGDDLAGTDLKIH